MARGADGIGLYRTEFLYLGVEREPSEEDHYRAYAEVVQAMGNRPVVIRTLDLGADKMGRQPPHQGTRNPDSGLASHSLVAAATCPCSASSCAPSCASALGNVQVMFPLVTTLQELRQAKMVLADAIEDLDECGMPFDRKLPVGIMVEVPATVMMLDQLLKEVDFISIGTNDLIQYTLAVDRGNSEVAERYQAERSGGAAADRSVDPASRRRRNVPVSVCGQMSGEVTYTMLLLGLGLRGFSVPPSAIPEIKKVCRSVSIPQCEEVARRAMQTVHRTGDRRLRARGTPQGSPGAASLTPQLPAMEDGRAARNLT